MASEIVQRVKELAAKPDDLSFTLGPVVEGEKTDSRKFFLDFHVCIENK